MWTHPFYPRYNSVTVPVPGYNSGHWVSVCRPFLLVPGKSSTLYSLLSLCFKMASDKAKWSNYENCHMGYSRWTQHHFVPVTRHLFPSTKCGQGLSLGFVILEKPLKVHSLWLYNKSRFSLQKKQSEMVWYFIGVYIIRRTMNEWEIFRHQKTNFVSLRG